MKLFYDKIALWSGHSLIMSPTSMSPVDTREDIYLAPKEITSLGFFGLDTPNENPYYKDINANDLVVKDGDVAHIIMRALSQVIVHKRWNPTDFSKPGVLKASMNMLVGQTLYKNHEAIVGNEVGSVAKTFWQESFTQKGIKIPAGINMELVVDSKSHPTVIRSMSLKPPAIHSNSVTVSFKFAKSHPSLSDEEFMSKLGQYGSDGKLIRKIVEQIVGYHETSLVAHGADPFAQIQDKKGKIANPEYANSIYSLAYEGKETPKVYWVNYTDVESLSMSESTPEEQINNNNNIYTMKRIELLLLMASCFGLSLEEKPDMDDTQFKAYLKGELDKLGIKDLQAKKEGLSAENTTLSEKVTKLEGEIAALKEEASKITPGLIQEHGSFVQALRDEATKQYKLSLGKEEPKEDVLASIAKADVQSLKASLEAYKQTADKNYPVSCGACGSVNITRASSTPDNGDGGTPAPKKSSPRDTSKDKRTASLTAFNEEDFE